MDIIKATEIMLRDTTPTTAAFQDIFSACVYHATENCNAVREFGRERQEAVHQARVGIRRVRSALALFKPLLKKSQRKQVDNDLQKAGQHLGPCRDWDVFLTETLPRIERKFADAVDTQAIHHAASAQQIAAYTNLDANHIITTTHSARVEVNDHRPIDYWAADLLDHQFFDVRHCCRHIGTADDRHSLRKAMKKLRYAVEFLGSLFDSKKVHVFLDACKDMQDILGKMNDANATIHLLNNLQLPEQVIAQPITWAKQHEERAEDHLIERITEFRSTKPFWN